MGSISGEPPRTESEGFYEMLWDCEHCEAKGLLGKSQRHCPQCGSPQNPDKRYFPKPEEQKRVDGHKYEGSDRQCPACNAPMGNAAKNCAQCGAPLDGSKEVKGIAAPVRAPVKGKRIWPYVVGGIVLIIVLTWYFFIRTKDAKLAVSAHRWERSIAIEKYGDYPGEAWRDEMPKDATSPACEKKKRSTKQVPDGEECKTERVDKKDGTFEQVKKCTPKTKAEDVMDDWCTYTQRTWKKIDAMKTSGTGMTAVWPTANVPPTDAQPVVGATRSGAKSETLYLDFGKKGSCDVKQSKWEKYKDGDKVKLEVRARSGDIVCDSF